MCSLDESWKIDLEGGAGARLAFDGDPSVRLADDAKRWIVNKTCGDRSYGARPLRRALQKHVEDPLSEALIQGQLAEASLVAMFVDGAELNFRSITIDDEGHERINDLLLTQ